MPKKSKKEKILADLRRRARTEQSLTTEIPTLVKEDASPTFRFQVKKEVVPPVHTPGPQQTSELTAIKRDLSKTFILATLAIAAEVIIYWFRR
jgi:hypothetical protein